MPNEENSPKRNYAVALRYSQDDEVPRIVASGPGEIAKKILEIAKEHKVPIERDDSLVSVLSQLEVGVNIPPECYRVVAEILSFLFRTDASWREKKLKDIPELGPSSE